MQILSIIVTILKILIKIAAIFVPGVGVKDMFNKKGKK